MLIHGNKEYIIETSKEERKNEPLIEMTLSLGILEPKEEEEDINEILLPTKTEDNVIPKLSIKSPISKDAITVIEQDTDISTSKAIQSDGEQNTSTIITPDHMYVYKVYVYIYIYIFFSIISRYYRHKV